MCEEGSRLSLFPWNTRAGILPESTKVLFSLLLFKYINLYLNTFSFMNIFITTGMIWPPQLLAAPLLVGLKFKKPFRTEPKLLLFQLDLFQGIPSCSSLNKILSLIFSFIFFLICLEVRHDFFLSFVSSWSLFVFSMVPLVSFPRSEIPFCLTLKIR